MKIFYLCVVFSCSWLAAAVPTNHGLRLQRIKKEITSGSDSGMNLVQGAISTLSESRDNSNTTDTPLLTSNVTVSNANATVSSNDTQAIVLPKLESRNVNVPEDGAAFHSDEFKVRVLDLTKPNNYKAAKSSEVTIHEPLQQKAPHFPVPEHNISPEFGSIDQGGFAFSQHFVIPTFYDGHYPIHISSLNPNFGYFGDYNQPPVFEGISSAFPIIELPSGSEHYPIIGISELPVLPEFGGIHQGIELLQPETVDFSGGQIQPDKESVSVEAADVKKTNKHKNGKELFWH